VQNRSAEKRPVIHPTAAVLAAAAFLALCAFVATSSQHAAAAVASADLRIAKSDSPDPVSAGLPLTYSIQVRNAGPDVATDVVVTDVLPRGVTFLAAQPVQGKCSVAGRNVTCRLGTIADEDGPAYKAAGPAYVPTSATITITVLAPRRAGRISNTATVTSGVGDPRTGNNSATAITRVVKPRVPKPTPKKPVTCHGRAATLVGTAGADFLAGTTGRDVIVARNGNDRIFSSAGNDLICAGRGADLVKSGGRPDRVLAGPGADRVFGRGGGDVLRGGSGRDRLRGGRGADLLGGGSGADRCFGGPGGDTLSSC
jgi:uncharacterized repeat protein (TIGR01451 family)